MSKPTSVYLITSPTGMQYVGISHQPEKRWKQHSLAHSFIGYDIRYYGDEMEYEILSTWDKREEACAEEIRLIKKLGTRFPKGYNLTGGGGGVLVSNMAPEDRLAYIRKKEKMYLVKEIKLRKEAFELDSNKPRKPVQEVILKDYIPHRTFKEKWDAAKYKAYISRRREIESALQDIHRQKLTLGLI